MNLRSLSLVIPKLLRIFFWTIQADQSRHKFLNHYDLNMEKFQSYQFRQINPDDDIAFLKKNKNKSFQSYQFRQINPDTEISQPLLTTNSCFNRINSGRSIPTERNTWIEIGRLRVSIVSIQADQSRRWKHARKSTHVCEVSIVSIQADQSRQEQSWLLLKQIWTFQSYQFRQINPDEYLLCWKIMKVSCFNRINSGRSIPTITMPTKAEVTKMVSIVSIQADQSRQGDSIIIVAHYNVRFQSYQFRQINPDCWRLWFV